MNNLVHYPRYSIYLIPSKNFFNNLNSFYKKNNFDSGNISQNTHEIYCTVKAPFYKSDIYSENDLIDNFNSLKKKDSIQKILNKTYIAKQYIKLNTNFVLELDNDPEFNFIIHDIMRSFDIYRKTLNTSEIKKDLLRFNNLSEKELIYYQIWGYPYYFECSIHHISFFNFDTKLYNCNFDPVEYESLKLLKQDSSDEYFKELANITV